MGGWMEGALTLTLGSPGPSLAWVRQGRQLGA